MKGDWVAWKKMGALGLSASKKWERRRSQQSKQKIQVARRKTKKVIRSSQ